MSGAVVVHYEPADDWQEADLSVLNGPYMDPPTFPVDVLGEWWGPWCETVAKGANAPVDYAATGLIVTAGALIGDARVAASTRSLTP